MLCPNFVEVHLLPFLTTVVFMLDVNIWRAAHVAHFELRVACNKYVFMLITVARLMLRFARVYMFRNRFVYI